MTLKVRGTTAESQGPNLTMCHTVSNCTRTDTVANVRHGYARVSDPHDEVNQRTELRLLGADDYLVDAGLIGPSLTRQALTELLSRCQPGDEVVVTRLSRLARSLPDLREILLALADAGVDLRVGPTLYGLGTADQTLSDVVGLMAGFEGGLGFASRGSRMEGSQGTGTTSGPPAQARPHTGTDDSRPVSPGRTDRRRIGRVLRREPIHDLPAP